MSMDEAPSRPFMVMDDILSHYGDLHERRWLDWEVVECKKIAIGCGAAEKYILDGIELCVLRGDDDDPKHYPDMSIRASADVFFHVGMMIDDDTADIWGRDTNIACCVRAVEGNTMVVRLAFTARHVTGSFRAYYLVFDSADMSLTMIPAQGTTVGATCPLPLRRQDGGYSLAVLASRVNHATDCPALCLWSLPAPGDISSQKDMDQWVVKDRDRVDGDADRRFNFHVAFSYNGNAVWGDLTQGIMYCSYTDLLKAGGDHVNLKYISLPRKHRIPHHEAIMMGEARVFRNMGLVGSSIWFVAITPSESDSSAGDTTVEVWTLDLTQQMPPKEEHRREWAMHINFTMQSVWELDAFSENCWLPKTLPRFPILRQEDAGILYLLLPDPDGTKGHLVGIDVGQSSTCKTLRIVSSRRLAVPWMRIPLVLPRDFFKPPDTVD